MQASTDSNAIFAQFLEEFSDVWVLGVEGVLNQRSREYALRQATDILANMPTEKSDLLQLLASIARDVPNFTDPRTEQYIRLRILGYVIVKYLTETFPATAEADIRAIDCTAFNGFLTGMRVN